MELTLNKIKEIRDLANNVYAWDFVFSEGDTIKDKYRNLVEILYTLCVRKDGEALVIANKELSSVIEVSYFEKEEFIPEYKELDGMIYVGEIKKNCGDNYISGFRIYKTENIAKDEILVYSGNRASLIRVFNFIF